MKIIQASCEQLDEIVRLFNSYRMFYQQESNIEGARQFLQPRLEHNQSVIFLAVDEHDKGLGFTQLYPTFSSVSMSHRWILNDLFVDATARGTGVANALMETTETFAINSGADGIELSTAIDNMNAQHLYEKRQWQKGTGFFQYSKRLGS